MLYPVIGSLVDGLIMFLQILSWLIVLNAILSFFVDPKHPIRALLKKITEPVMAPFRKLTKKFTSSHMPIDFTPMLAIIAILIIVGLLERFSRYLYNIPYFS